MPFLDVLNALCDEKLPLTIPDYEEFGNPLQDSFIYDSISSYCPYENIKTQEYPFVYLLKTIFQLYHLLQLYWLKF